MWLQSNEYLYLFGIFPGVQMVEEFPVDHGWILSFYTEHLSSCDTTLILKAMISRYSSGTKCLKWLGTFLNLPLSFDTPPATYTFHIPFTPKFIMWCTTQLPQTQTDTYAARLTTLYYYKDTGCLR